MTRERNPFGPIAASRHTSRTIFFYVPTIYRAVHRNASNPPPKIWIEVADRQISRWALAHGSRPQDAYPATSAKSVDEIPMN